MAGAMANILTCHPSLFCNQDTSSIFCQQLELEAV